MSISNNEFPKDTDDSDSEFNLDDANPDYYQPISSDDEDDSDSDPNLDFQMIYGHTEPEINEEEEEEGEVIEEEATYSEISRAFREEENRRFVPDWSNQVSESHWIDQLRNLRLQQRQPLSSAAVATGITET
ncbi:hypothetical protein MKX03_030601 [Papaver bracteatum]|nr:hypothetical protein MKX03_030601 [Papaver bracteatum]